MIYSGSGSGSSPGIGSGSGSGGGCGGSGGVSGLVFPPVVAARKTERADPTVTLGTGSDKATSHSQQSLHRRHFSQR